MEGLRGATSRLLGRRAGEGRHYPTDSGLGKKRKILIAISICAAFLSGSGAALACEIWQVTPNQGLPGDVLEVTLEGFGFGYSEVYEINFGPGIGVEVLNMVPKTVEPIPDSFLLQLSISETASPGPRTIVVDGYVASCAAEDAFVVEEAGPQENQPPVADFTYSPSEPSTGDQVAFDASASFDPDGEIADYFWDFGDGATGAGVTVTHAYPEPSNYGVTLTVFDNQELSDSISQTVFVRERADAGLNTVIDHVIWNGFPSNIGETGTAIDLGEGSPSTRFLNVVADFNGDGTIAEYTTDLGMQPEWIVRNLPVPPDLEGTLLLDASFPILDETITAGALFEIGDSLLDGPATAAPVFPTETVVVGTTTRLATSPGKEEPIPPSLQPTEVGFGLTIWGFPLDIVFRGGVPDIPQKPNECAPTATANSLRWLAKKHGFNDKLPASDSDLVKGLGQAMKTSSTVGTFDADMVNGKKKFIKDKGLALTVEGQDNNGAGELTKAKPTLEFILEQLKKGQDVEMGFTFTGDGGHWVTIVGVVKFGNKLGVYIHDPDDADKGTPKTQFYELEVRPDGFLRLKGYGHDNFVDIVVAESPVPKCPTQDPTAVISPTTPRASSGHSFPRTITLSGASSHDNDDCGDPPAIRKYEWSVAENLLPNPEQPSAQPLNGVGETFTVSFKAPGTYTIKLTVTDNDGETDDETVEVKIGNRKPRIWITDRRIELTPRGEIRRWVVRFKTKDPDRPDKDLQKNVDVNYQDSAGTHQAGGAPPLSINFTGGWAIVSAEITATDPHGAKGVLNDTVLLWRSGAARQQLQQHLQGGGANAFLQAQLQRILRNKKGQDWIDNNPTKASNAINRALNRIRNMKLRNTFRKVVVSGQSEEVTALQEEEVWEGMYQDGLELLGIVPTADFSFSPDMPDAGEQVTFDASASVPSEEGSELVNYEWDFDGDGEVDAEGPTASFTFEAPRDYDVTLRVVDDAGEEDLEIRTIFVGGAGGLTIEEALDVNQNNVLDDDEILWAIELWINGEEVPGTGQTISDEKMLELINKWINGTQLSAAGQALVGDGFEPLKLEQTWLSHEANGLVLNVNGRGIEHVNLQVFNLAGQRLLNHTASGRKLHFQAADAAGRPWANGVYLYVVTARGANEQVVRSPVRKMALLR